MDVRQFIAWSRRATTAQRAEGAGVLARAYLYADLDASERREAELAMMTLLDDPSPLVRCAIADAMASAPEAPRALILTLACDQPDIAAPVLSYSPVLSDAELVDCAVIGDAFAQNAIALRARVPSAVCATLAEIGARETMIALAANPGADIPEFALLRMIARFGDDGEMREALLARPSLPPTARNELVGAATADLLSFVTDCGWLAMERAERLGREERDRANVVIAIETAEDRGRQSLRDLVTHLCAAGQLTTSLLLRALLSGDRALFIAALAELSGLGETRVDGIVGDFNGSGFAALYLRAGLPGKYFVAFRAALEAQDMAGDIEDAEARLSPALVEQVLATCEAEFADEFGSLTALLRRFQREAAREAARCATARLAAEQASEPVFYPGVSAVSRLIDLVALEAELLAAA